MVGRRHGPMQPARTLLEQLIRERQQTFEEFADYTEAFARDHGEPGTLSVRHLQRLVAGRQPDGTPLGPLRPATARLLENIFGLAIDDLLACPSGDIDTHNARHHLSIRARPLRVGVAVVLKEPEVLIVCRRDAYGAGISWQFPSGVMKPGASPEAVAVRETLVETGVHCAATHAIGCRIHPITLVYCHYVLCRFLAGKAGNLDADENIGVTWTDKARLTHFIDPAHIFAPVAQLLGVETRGYRSADPRQH